MQEAIQRALDHGEPYDMEARFITARGKDLWTRTICHPEIIDGKTAKLIGTFQDITDQKKAEEALKELPVLYSDFEKEFGSLPDFSGNKMDERERRTLPKASRCLFWRPFYS